MRPRRQPASPAVLAVALVLLLIGVWLRILNQPWQTNIWAVDFVVYYEPQARALSAGALHHWLFAWEGLHPPVSGIIHGALMAAGVPLAGQWATSTAAMLGAGAVVAGLVARVTGSGLAGLGVLAAVCLSPLQANYGLTTSPYTTAILFVALASAAIFRAVEEPTPRRLLIAGVAGGIALQTHVLALAVVGAQAIWLALRGPSWVRAHRRALATWGATLGVFVIPLVVAALAKTGDPWTFHQDNTEALGRTLVLAVHERFGGRTTGAVASVLVGLAALGGALRRPRGLAGLLALSGLAWVGALLVFHVMGVAAPRQSHYFPTAHLLFLGAGAVGVLELRGVLGGKAWLGGALLGLGGLLWAGPAVSWQLQRAADARARLEAHGQARETVRAAYEQAGEGDVVVYLWAYSFLNDEPEYLDPFAAWPVGRFGGFCGDHEIPRGLCLSGGGAGFFFDPTSFAGSLDGLDSALAQWVDQARAPGEATFVVVAPADAGPHPWPVDAWFERHGGVAQHLDGVSVWTMPSGLRIEP